MKITSVIIQINVFIIIMATKRRLYIKKKHGRQGLHPQILVSLAGVKCLVRQKEDLNAAVDEDGNSLLQAAILQNCCQSIVKYLVSHGADIYYKNNTGATALHLCCLHTKFHPLKTLLHLACDVNVVDNAGQSALHYACRRGCVKMVTLLLSKDVALDLKNNKGNTPLHEACYSTNTDTCQIVEKLIKHGCAVNEVNDKGELPLHIACREQRSTSVMNRLLGLTDDINKEDHDNQTCLHHAAMNTNPNSSFIMVSLVKAGVDITVVDNNGVTAFEKGLQRDTEKVLKFLVTATMNLPEYSWQLRTGNWPYDLIKSMERNSLILPAKTQDGRGNTLMHHINHKMNHHLLQYLASSADIDVTIQNNEGVTPMHIAAEEDTNNVFSNFLDAGGQVTVVDRQNRVPFLIALENNNKIPLYLSMTQQSWEIISFLEVNPALIPLVLKQNKRGKSLLHFSCRYNCYSLVSFLADKGDVNAMSYSGHNNPLHKVAKTPQKLHSRGYLTTATDHDDARKKRTEQIIDTLVNNGGQIHAENIKGLTPLAVAFLATNTYAFRKLLCIACCDNQVDSCRKLFGQMDINRRNSSRDSPLLLACKLGCSTKIIQTLLELGADCTYSTYFTRRPLLYAADNKDMATVEILLAHGDNYSKPCNKVTTGSSTKPVKPTTREVSAKSLHLCIQNNDFESLKYQLQLGVKLSLLNELNHGNSLLHIVVSGKSFIHTLALASLLEHSAKVNVVNSKGYNPCESILLPPTSVGDLTGLHCNIYGMAALRLFISAGSTADLSKFKVSHLKELTNYLLQSSNKLELMQCLIMLGAAKDLHNTFALGVAYFKLLMNPLSLQQCCAIVIRQNMKPNAWVGIRKVTLPARLKSYVICGYQMGSLTSTDIQLQI